MRTPASITPAVQLFDTGITVTEMQQLRPSMAYPHTPTLHSRIDTQYPLLTTNIEEPPLTISPSISLSVRRIPLLLLVTVAAIVLAACGTDAGTPTAPATPAEATPTATGTAADDAVATPTFPPEDRKLVAVSFGVLADITANLGGDRIEVWSIVPSNADPHTFEVSARDIARLSDAELLITVGGRFEAFAERASWRRAAREAGLPTLTVVDSIDVIIRDLIIDHGDHIHDYTGGDPHFWLDPQRAIALLPVITERLIELDPKGEAYFRANEEAYAAALAEADAALEAAVASIPPERRVLIVHHNAYGYLAFRFDFEVLGSILPSSGEGEPSAADIAQLNRTITEHNVTTVFREPQLESTILNALARDHGITVGILMTDAFTPEAPTYLDLIHFNANSLAGNLGG